MTDQTVPDFVVANVAHAAGILSAQLGDAEEWRMLGYVPETFKALRSMPPNFQDEVGKVVIADLFKVFGYDAMDLQADPCPLIDFDMIIAAALTDAFTMTMQTMQMEAQHRQKTTNKLLRGI
jgi:hypothetical protein